MSHVKDRNSGPPLQIFELEAHLLTQFSIEIAQRLIEQQYLGLLDQGPRQRDSLLFSARKLAGETARQLFKTDGPENFFELCLDHFFGQLLELQGIGDIVVHCHVWPDRIILKHHADGPLLGGNVDACGRTIHLGFANVNFSVARFLQTSDTPQNGALAAAARTQQRKKLLVANGESYMYKKILVPLDGSDLSATVLPYVRWLAAALKTPVELLHVQDVNRLAPYSPPLQIGYLENIAESFSQGSDVKCTIECGNPAELIIHKTSAEPGVLVAMATHGYTGAARWLLGSVALKALRGLHSDLLTVRPGGGDDSGHGVNRATLDCDRRLLKDADSRGMNELAAFF